MSGDAFVPHYPMFLNLVGRSVVIVGEGEAAERKANAFLRYGADVIVISAEPTHRILEMEAQGLINVAPREYASGDLAGVALTVCAGVSDEVATRVARDADALGCPVNVPGHPELCNYLIPTSLRRGPLQIAISTSGAAPTVAKRLKEELKERYGEEWGVYVELLGGVRALATARIEDPAVRDELLAEVSAADLLSRIEAGEQLDAESVFAEFAPAVSDDATESSSAVEE